MLILKKSNCHFIVEIYTFEQHECLKYNWQFLLHIKQPYDGILKKIKNHQVPFLI